LYGYRGKWGYLNKNQEEVVPFFYDDAFNFFREKSQGKLIAWVYKNNTYSHQSERQLLGLVDENGKKVTSIYYQNAYPPSKEGIIALKQYDKWGFYHVNGTEILKPKYDDTKGFQEGKAVVGENKSINNKYALYYGFIDNQGKEIIPCKYVQAKGFSDGLALVGVKYQEYGLVRKNIIYGFVDKQGEIKVPMIYFSAKSFSENLAPVAELDRYNDYKWGFVDTTGKRIVPLRYEDAQNFSEGLAAVKHKGLWGYINKLGQEVIPFKYHEVRQFSEGLASVKLNNKWGFIDKSGKVIVSLKYKAAGNFSEGLAMVMNPYTEIHRHQNMKTKGIVDYIGYIDSKGKEVIPLVYEKGTAFSNGTAEVSILDEYFLIDKNGNSIDGMID